MQIDKRLQQPPLRNRCPQSNVIISGFVLFGRIVTNRGEGTL